MMLDAISTNKVFEILSKYEKQLDLIVKIPLQEYHERYERLWNELEKRNVDLGFFFWYREMPGDGLYLTGYNPTIERASGVITPGKPPMLLVGPESGLLSREVGLGLQTSFVTEFSIPDEYYEGVTCPKLTDVIREYAGRKISTIAYLTSCSLIPVKFFDILKHDINPAAAVIDATDILEDMRYEKSPAEFACMHQANTIANAAVRAMLAIIKPGMRELEVASVGDFVMKALGANGYGVETMVMSGHRSRSIIGPATNKVLKEGEIVSIGCSPCYEGYRGVCRRVFVLGKPDTTQKRYFEILKKGAELAQAEIKNVVANNLSINRIDLAARNYFAAQDLDGTNAKSLHFFSTCHGTGLTECLEKKVVHPFIEDYYGESVGFMMDLGLYGHTNDVICGGSIENAFFKKGNELICFTDVPDDVQDMVEGNW